MPYATVGETKHIDTKKAKSNCFSDWPANNPLEGKSLDIERCTSKLKHIQRKGVKIQTVKCGRKA